MYRDSVRMVQYWQCQACSVGSCQTFNNIDNMNLYNKVGMRMAVKPAWKGR